MSEDLIHKKNELIAQIHNASSLKEIEELKIAFLGKAGIVSLALKSLASLDIEQKKIMGQKFNILKQELSDEISLMQEKLQQKELETRLAAEKIDTSLPIRENGSPSKEGKIHPISQVKDEICAILSSFGFSLAEGPDIEHESYNFDLLNIGKDHPSRQMHDSFYMPGKEMVLRTHTSPIQIRAMQAGKPPFRIAALGRTFRYDYDATHVPMFHQVEGLVIDKNIHMGHLKECLMSFLKAFFEIENAPIRFRTAFFPFTEPSAEVDVQFEKKNGELILGQGENWLEILGCGMVHPNVLRNAGVDPEEFQGFAFGIGVERLAMMKYGIADLRKFFEGDLRWNSHYGFSSFDIPSLMWGLTK